MSNGGTVEKLAAVAPSAHYLILNIASPSHGPFGLSAKVVRVDIRFRGERFLI
jgi:hypothetical protein